MCFSNIQALLRPLIAAVLGAAVVLADRRSLTAFRGGHVARVQYPLLAAMVAFAVGGLLLLLGQ